MIQPAWLVRLGRKQAAGWAVSHGVLLSQTWDRCLGYRLGPQDDKGRALRSGDCTLAPGGENILVRSSEKSQSGLPCEGMSSSSVKGFQQDAVKGTPEMGRCSKKAS